MIIHQQLWAYGEVWALPCEKELGAVGGQRVALSHGCVCGGAGRRDAGADVARVAALACSVAGRLQLLACRLRLLTLQLKLHLQLLELRGWGSRRVELPSCGAPHTRQLREQLWWYRHREKDCVRLCEKTIKTDMKDNTWYTLKNMKI